LQVDFGKFLGNRIRPPLRIRTDPPEKKPSPTPTISKKAIRCPPIGRRETMTEKTDPGMLRFLEENYLDEDGNFVCLCCATKDEIIKERGEIVKLLEEQVAKYKRLFPPTRTGKNAGTGSACTSGRKKGTRSSTPLYLIHSA